jgi:1-aminocyclopropane-1-carboxylate deaminase
LPAEIGEDFDVIMCAVGTGGTLAGIASGLGEGQRAIGVAVLKGAQFLEGEVAELQRQAFGESTDNWALDYDHHFGGYAKRTAELDAFVDDFEARHGLRLDWVYVAKMMMALFDAVARGEFARGSTVVAVISGSDEVPAFS